MLGPYIYRTPSGEPSRKVVRKPDKTFPQYHWDSEVGGWRKRAKGLPSYAYMLPEVIKAAKQGEVIFWVEGEKDAINLWRAGYAATTAPGGSLVNWTKETVQGIPEDTNFVVVADWDAPGYKKAAETYNGLIAAGMNVTGILRPAVGEFQEDNGVDVSDHLGAGLDVDDLVPCKAEALSTLQKKGRRTKTGTTLHAVGSPVRSGSRIDWVAEAVSKLDQEGGRHNTLIWLAHQMRDDLVDTGARAAPGDALEHKFLNAFDDVFEEFQNEDDPLDYDVERDKALEVFRDVARPARGEPEFDGAPLPEFLPDGYRLPKMYRVNKETGVLQHVNLKETIPIFDMVSPVPVWITGRAMSSSGEMFLQVRWREKTHLVEREVLLTNKISQLAALDFPIYEGSKRQMIKYFFELEEANRDLLEITPVLEQVGWQLDGTFLSRPEQFEGNIHDELHYWVERLGTHGSLEGWQGMYQKYDHRLIQFCIACGLSAPLLAMLDEPSPFVVSLQGPTSKGKSTILRLIAGLWGIPGKGGKKGYVFSWNNPQGYLESKGGRLNGLPFILDELGSAKPDLVERIIYDITGGQTRGRADRNVAGKTHEGIEWRATLITAGELPINIGNERGGTRARTITLHDFDLGMSGAALRELNGYIDEHYGWIGPAFVEEIQRLGRDYLNQRYNKLVARLQKMTPSEEGSDVIQRRCQCFAVVALAADIMGINMDLKSLLFNDPDWWVGLISARGYEEQDDMTLACAQVIHDQSYSHRRTKFYHEGIEIPDFDRDGKKTTYLAPNTGGGYGGLWGWWHEDMDAPVFFPTKLRELCKDAGFDFDEHAPEMKRRGWLDTNNDPPTICQKTMRHSVLIPGRRTVKVYVFNRKFMDDMSGMGV